MGLLSEKEELLSLKQVFIELDKNNDGEISHEELQSAFAKQNQDTKWLDVLKKIDLDGNRKVNF